MGRPITTRDPAQLDAGQPELDPVAINDAETGLALQQQELRTIDIEMALSGDYSRERARAVMLWASNMATMASLTIGQLLLQVRTHESPRGFAEFREEFQISPSTADRYMVLARRWGKSSKHKQVAHRLGATRALELLSQPDSVIEALVQEEGLLEGRDVDQLARMTTREVRALLSKKDAEKAELQARIEAQEEVLGDKDKKLNEYDLQLRGSRPDERVAVLMKAMDAAATDAMIAMNSLFDTAAAIRLQYEQAQLLLPEHVAERFEQNLALVQGWLGRVEQELMGE